MDFYRRYQELYLAADETLRQAAKKHWLKVHAENLEKENRNDLVIFSAQMLAAIMLAENRREGK